MENSFKEKSENGEVRRGLRGGQNGCHCFFWMPRLVLGGSVLPYG
jgi:hypothetical protein